MRSSGSYRSESTSLGREEGVMDSPFWLRDCLHPGYRTVRPKQCASCTCRSQELRSRSNPTIAACTSQNDSLSRLRLLLLAIGHS
eukprot:752432-Hanusia_phi.AAC.2